MQYIARTEMQYQGADGVMRQAHPGDALPEFASWPYILRIAHLEEGSVEEVGGEYAQNLSVLGGRLTFEGRRATPLELIDHVSAPLAEAPVVAEADKSVGEHACPECDKSFDRPSRLAKHMQKHV